MIRRVDAATDPLIMTQLRVGLRLVVLLWSLAAVVRTEEEWIDPYDMLNYDAGTKTMRKQAEVTPLMDTTQHGVAGDLE